MWWFLACAESDVDGAGVPVDDCDVSEWYRDGDGDGWGVVEDVVTECLPPDGYTGTSGDCNDADPAENPAATDAGGVDLNCDGDVAVIEDCPWVGTWTAQAVECDGSSHKPWFDDHDGATLVMAHDPIGGCAVTATLTGQFCERSEAWHLGLPVGVTVDARYDGVESCVPDSCAFGPDHPAPCIVGGLVGEDSVRVEVVTPTELVATGLMQDTAPGCASDLVTQWILTPLR